jgi:hypothetical protein
MMCGSTTTFYDGPKILVCRKYVDLVAMTSNIQMTNLRSGEQIFLCMDYSGAPRTNTALLTGSAGRVAVALHDGTFTALDPPDLSPQRFFPS